MARSKETALELTYPLRTAARLTGLSPELLRAWERRYGVVRPSRTPGGTRRYTAQDLERLRLLKAAVDAGHRIGQVAELPAAELRACGEPPTGPTPDGLTEILAALDRLDAVEAQRLLSLQLAAFGPVRFARDLACPLVREIGERWADGRMGIASEHLATGVLRSLLGAALQPTAVSLRGPRVVFATPSGEPHELGLLMAALTAMGAGANPIYLGAQLPLEDLLSAVERADAAALALGLVTLPGTAIAECTASLRGELPGHVRLWLGGAAASGVALPAGVEYLADLESLEQWVVLLASQPPRSA